MVKIWQISNCMMRLLHENRHTDFIMKLHSMKENDVTKEEFGKFYDLIYVDDEMSEDLEDLFEIFNINHPKHYCGRSLSSGDIVETSQGKFLCCPIGWKKLDY